MITRNISSIFAWICVSCLAARCEIIPSTNLIAWSLDIVGVPGGIPNRTAIFTNLSAGSTAAEINNAISLCPSNSVVLLGSGTFEVTNAISLGYKLA